MKKTHVLFLSQSWYNVPSNQVLITTKESKHIYTDILVWVKSLESETNQSHLPSVLRYWLAPTQLWVPDSFFGTCVIVKPSLSPILSWFWFFFLPLVWTLKISKTAWSRSEDLEKLHLNWSHESLEVNLMDWDSRP